MCIDSCPDYLVAPGMDLSPAEIDNDKPKKNQQTSCKSQRKGNRIEIDYEFRQEWLHEKNGQRYAIHLKVERDDKPHQCPFTAKICPFWFKKRTADKEEQNDYMHDN